MSALVGRFQAVLASASPRRRALLAELGLAFRVEPIEVDEAVELLGRSAGSPARAAEALALAKALACAARGGGDDGVEDRGAETSRGLAKTGARRTLIIGADTVVVAPDGGLIGKAATDGEARAALARLDGAWHQVVTGVALLAPEGRVALFHARSEVRIGPLALDALERYLASGQWRGKAGAYGIQDSPTPVTGLRGSYSNVVGLPLEALGEALARLAPAVDADLSAAAGATTLSPSP